MANSKLRLLGRILTPSPVVTAYYLAKYGAKVSPRAEVELSKNLVFGADCVVGSFTKIKASEGPLTFGDRCGIATGCFLSAGAAGITVGDNFICGPNVSIIGMNYAFDDPDRHLEDQGTTSRGIRIGRNVWVGAGSVLLDGTVLGDNCIVVANSLVNRRYPDGAIIQGNPGEILMKRSVPERGNQQT